MELGAQASRMEQQVLVHGKHAPLVKTTANSDWPRVPLRPQHYTRTYFLSADRLQPPGAAPQLQTIHAVTWSACRTSAACEPCHPTLLLFRSRPHAGMPPRAKVLRFCSCTGCATTCVLCVQVVPEGFEEVGCRPYLSAAQPPCRSADGYRPGGATCRLGAHVHAHVACGSRCRDMAAHVFLFKLGCSHQQPSVCAAAGRAELQAARPARRQAALGCLDACMHACMRGSLIYVAASRACLPYAP